MISLGALELRPVPAGMVLCPAGSPAPGPHDVAYAVPAQRERPAVLCAVPDDARSNIPGAIALLSLLLNRHSWTRHPLLLVPVSGVDLLPLARALVREMSLEVEVLSGFPVSGPGTWVSRVLLTDASGQVTWSPFIASVLCRTSSPDPAPLIWRTPVEGLTVVDTVRPVYGLGPDWHLTLTRGGFWLHRPHDGPLPVDSATVRADSVQLDVGTAGIPLPPGTTGILAGLISALSNTVRSRLLITVHSGLDATARAELDDIAARHHARTEYRDTSSAWARPAPEVRPETRSGSRSEPRPEIRPELRLNDASRPDSAPATSTSGPAERPPAATEGDRPREGGRRRARNRAAQNPDEPRWDTWSARDDTPAAQGNPAAPPHSAVRASPTVQPNSSEQENVSARTGSAGPANPATSPYPAAPTGPAAQSDPAGLTGSAAQPNPAVSPYPSAHTGQAAPFTSAGQPKPAVHTNLAAPSTSAAPPYPAEHPNPAVSSHPAVRTDPAAHAKSVAHANPTPQPDPNAPTVPPTTSSMAPVLARATLPTEAETRRSTAAERDRVRAIIGSRWDDHAPLVRRAFTAIPALSAGDLAAAAVDLVALSLFLAARNDDEFGPAAIRSAPQTPAQHDYRACLASALSLLPTHRGPVVRGVDAARLWREGPPTPGAVLTESGPVGATALTGSGIPRPATSAMYLIWAQTVRILTPLLDNEPLAGDVMFDPGTRLVVLDTRLGGQNGLDLVFLQELPANAPSSGPARERTLEKLRDAIDSATLRPSGGRTVWPPYALGLLGGGASVGAATS